MRTFEVLLYSECRAAPSLQLVSALDRAEIEIVADRKLVVSPDAVGVAVVLEVARVRACGVVAPQVRPTVCRPSKRECETYLTDRSLE